MTDKNTTPYTPTVSELVAQIVAGEDSAKTTFAQIMSAKALDAVESFREVEED